MWPSKIYARDKTVQTPTNLSNFWGPGNLGNTVTKIYNAFPRRCYTAKYSHRLLQNLLPALSSTQSIFSLFECVVVVDAQQAVAMYVCSVQLYLRNKVSDINWQLADLVAVCFLFARSSYSSSVVVCFQPPNLCCCSTRPQVLVATLVHIHVYILLSVFTLGVRLVCCLCTYVPSCHL